MKKQLYIISLFGLALLFTPNLSLSETSYKNRLELGIQGGGAFFEGTSNINDAEVFGGRLGYNFTEHVGLEASYLTGSSDLDNLNIDTDLSVYHGELLIHVSQEKVRPFFSLGAGILDVSPDVGESQSDTLAQAGAGVKWFLQDWLSARLDAKYNLNLDDGKGPNLGTLTVGLSWLIGGLSSDDGSALNDIDGDGVKDSKDNCPNTPLGAGVDKRGCPYDDDKDGVLNEFDNCPGTKEGKAVDQTGCASKDKDGDGVLDATDICPDTPRGFPVNFQGCTDQDQDGILDKDDKCPSQLENINGFEDEDGCPDKKPIPKKTWILDNVQFNHGSAELAPSSQPTLKEAAQILKDNPDVRIEIQGHTDSVGKKDVNQSLSLKRATSVRDFLIKENIPANRMEIKGYGEEKPIGNNETKKGRRKNRRIEFKVLSQ